MPCLKPQLHKVSAMRRPSSQKRPISWLRRHKYRDCIRVKEPEVDKTAVRRLLTGGNTIPGIALVAGQSCSLK